MRIKRKRGVDPSVVVVVVVADPCRSVYIAHKMASDGVEITPSAAIL